jgi:hypothetical protein
MEFHIREIVTIIEEIKSKSGIVVDRLLRKVKGESSGSTGNWTMLTCS